MVATSRASASFRKELRTRTGFATFPGVAALRPRGPISPKNLASRKKLLGLSWDAAAGVGPGLFRVLWKAVLRRMGAYTPVAGPRLDRRPDLPRALATTSAEPPRHSRMSLTCCQSTLAIDAAIYRPNGTLYQLQPSFHPQSTEPEPTARARRAGKEFY